MFGYSRKERNTKLAKALGYEYDDAKYVEQAELRGLEPLSLKKMAIKFKLAEPLSDETTFGRGRYTRPEIKSLGQVFGDGPTIAITAYNRRADFKANKVAQANRRLEKNMKPYMDLMQFVMTNGKEIAQKPGSYNNPDMYLHFSDIDVTEEHITETDYCYAVSQKAELGFWGKHFRLA